MGRPRKNAPTEIKIHKKSKDPLTRCKKEKLNMLTDKKQFGFKLTESEINHLNSLATEISVQNYALSLIRKYL